MQKWVVYLSYGVYVDAPRELDPDNEVLDYATLQALAVQKMFEHGFPTVTAECTMEYENVTEEFNNE